MIISLDKYKATGGGSGGNNKEEITINQLYEWSKNGPDTCPYINDNNRLGINTLYRAGKKNDYIFYYKDESNSQRKPLCRLIYNNDSQTYEYATNEDGQKIIELNNNSIMQRIIAEHGELKHQVYNDNTYEWTYIDLPKEDSLLPNNNNLTRIDAFDYYWDRLELYNFANFDEVNWGLKIYKDPNNWEQRMYFNPFTYNKYLFDWYDNLMVIKKNEWGNYENVYDIDVFNDFNDQSLAIKFLLPTYQDKDYVFFCGNGSNKNSASGTYKKFAWAIPDDVESINFGAGSGGILHVTDEIKMDDKHKVISVAYNYSDYGSKYPWITYNGVLDAIVNFDFDNGIEKLMINIGNDFLYTDIIFRIREIKYANTSYDYCMKFNFNQDKEAKCTLDFSGADINTTLNYNALAIECTNGCNELNIIDNPNINTVLKDCIFRSISDFSNLIKYPILSAKRLFSENTNIVTAPAFNFVNLSNFGKSNSCDCQYLFNLCSKLESVEEFFNNFNNSKRSVGVFMGMFNGCKSLTSIPLIDFSGQNTDTSSANYLFGYSTLNNLTDLGGFKGLRVSIKNGFLDLCPNLTVDSLMNVINNLATVSGKSLKFGQANLDKLTAEQIAVATAKGWTLTA